MTEITYPFLVQITSNSTTGSRSGALKYPEFLLVTRIEQSYSDQYDIWEFLEPTRGESGHKYWPKLYLQSILQNGAVTAYASWRGYGDSFILSVL